MFSFKFKKCQKIAQLAKKTGQTNIGFSEEFGTSAWEGIRRSGWEFSILILAQLLLRRNFSAMDLLMCPVQWMHFSRRDLTKGQIFKLTFGAKMRMFGCFLMRGI